MRALFPLAPHHIGHVLNVSSSLQVLGVTAQPVIALMQDVFAFWDRSISQLEREPMRLDRFASEAGLTIAIWLNARAPRPALIASANGDLIPKAFHLSPSAALISISLVYHWFIGLPLMFASSLLASRADSNWLCALDQWIGAVPLCDPLIHECERCNPVAVWHLPGDKAMLRYPASNGSRVLTE